MARGDRLCAQPHRCWTNGLPISLNVIPGFKVVRLWKLADLVRLEEEDVLLDRLVDAFNEALGTWGEKV